MKLIELIKAKGLSAEQVADTIKVTRQSIYRWSKGTCMPTTDKVVALSKVLKVNVTTILKLFEK